MSGRRRAASSGEGGFTLIELLVVVIVLGLLAAIAVPVFVQQRRKAYDSSIKTDLRQTVGEMEAYFVEYGEYPSQTVDYVQIRASPGNVIYSHSVRGREGYCLAGYNPKGTANVYKTMMYWYDSVDGGLKARIGTSAEAGVATGACSYAVINAGDKVKGSN